MGAFGVKDERDMVLIGYLAFLDPPKESTAQAIQALKDHGVTTKILTGDNDKVTRTICKQVGLKVRNMLLGFEVEADERQRTAESGRNHRHVCKIDPRPESTGGFGAAGKRAHGGIHGRWDQRCRGHEGG